MNLKDKRDELINQEKGLCSEIFRISNDPKNYEKVIELRAIRKEVKNHRMFFQRYMETSRKVG